MIFSVYTTHFPITLTKSIGISQIVYRLKANRINYTPKNPKFTSNILQPLKLQTRERETERETDLVE